MFSLRRALFLAAILCAPVYGCAENSPPAPEDPSPDPYVPPEMKPPRMRRGDKPSLPDLPDAEGSVDLFKPISLEGEAPALSSRGAPRELFVAGPEGFRHVAKGGTSLKVWGGLGAGQSGSLGQLSPDGGSVILNLAQSDKGVVRVDMRTKKLVTLGPSGYTLLSDSWSPDGRFVLLSSSNALRLVSTDGTFARDLFSSRNSGYAGWSADGERLFWTFRDGMGFMRLEVVHKDEWTSADPTPYGFFITSAEFSPNGSELALSECAERERSHCRLRVIGADGSTLATLENTPEDALVHWALGGDLILFFRFSLDVPSLKDIDVEISGLRSWAFRTETASRSLGVTGLTNLSKSGRYATTITIEPNALHVIDLQTREKRVFQGAGCLACEVFTEDEKWLIVAGPQARAVSLDSNESVILGGEHFAYPMLLGQDTVALVESTVPLPARRHQHELRLASRTRGEGVLLTSFGERFDSHELRVVGAATDGSAFCTELHALRTKDGTPGGDAVQGGDALLLWWTDDPTLDPGSYQPLLLSESPWSSCYFPP